MGHNIPGTEESTSQIHTHDAIEVFGFHPDQQLVFIDAGVIDEDIDGAKVFDHRFDDRFSSFLLRYITAN